MGGRLPPLRREPLRVPDQRCADASTRAADVLHQYPVLPLWIQTAAVRPLTYAQPATIGKEQSRIGGGANYYVLGFNFKITGYYQRIINKVQPTTAAIKDLNRFVLQLQGFFY